LTWAGYDFVPGDDVFFEDNLIGEENGEFPSRWDIYSGNVENTQLGGDGNLRRNIPKYRHEPERARLRTKRITAGWSL